MTPAPTHTCGCGRPYGPADLSRCYGVQVCDGQHLAVFNCDCGSTRSIQLGPVPRWVHEAADDDLCLCGSDKQWVSRLTHYGITTTECEDCWERDDQFDRHINDHDRTLDLDQEGISL